MFSNKYSTTKVGIRVKSILHPLVRFKISCYEPVVHRSDLILAYVGVIKRYTTFGYKQPHRQRKDEEKEIRKRIIRIS